MHHSCKHSLNIMSSPKHGNISLLALSYCAKRRYFFLLWSPLSFFSFLFHPAVITVLLLFICCGWVISAWDDDDEEEEQGTPTSRSRPPPPQDMHAYNHTHDENIMDNLEDLMGFSELNEKFGWQWVERLLSQYLIDIMLQRLRTAWEGTKHSAMATTLKAP